MNGLDNWITGHYGEDEPPSCESCHICGGHCDTPEECAENCKINREYEQQRAERLAAQEAATINRIMGIGEE